MGSRATGEATMPQPNPIGPMNAQKQVGGALKVEDQALRVLERVFDVHEEGDGVFAVD